MGQPSTFGIRQTNGVKTFGFCFQNLLIKYTVSLVNNDLVAFVLLAQSISADMLIKEHCLNVDSDMKHQNKTNVIHRNMLLFNAHSTCTLFGSHGLKVTEAGSGQIGCQFGRIMCGVE